MTFRRFQGRRLGMICPAAHVATFAYDLTIPDHDRANRRVRTRMTPAPRSKRERTLHEDDVGHGLSHTGLGKDHCPSPDFLD